MSSAMWTHCPVGIVGSKMEMHRDILVCTEVDIRTWVFLGLSDEGMEMNKQILLSPTIIVFLLHHSKIHTLNYYFELQKPFLLVKRQDEFPVTYPVHYY
jgi:hypothetical protein